MIPLVSPLISKRLRQQNFPPAVAKGRDDARVSRHIRGCEFANIWRMPAKQFCSLVVETSATHYTRYAASYAFAANRWMRELPELSYIMVRHFAKLNNVVVNTRQEFAETVRNNIVVSASRVRVEYYVNENTFKERLQLYFIKNQRSSK